MFIGTLALALALLAPQGPLADKAVAYQLNSFHDGCAVGSSLVPPLQLKWSHDFGGDCSYPLIVDGMLYVTTRAMFGSGTTLYALDVQSGQTLWSQPIPGTYFWSNAAYDSGMIFVVNFDGLLRCFDAQSGTPLWQQLLGQTAFSSPPTAAGGIVYAGGAGSGGTLYAVDEQTHAVLWGRPVSNGDHSAPTVMDDTVFVSYACPQTSAFDRVSGVQRWHFSGQCSGGGGKTTVFHRGRVYVRDVFFTAQNGKSFDAVDGTERGTFSSTPAPAFLLEKGYFVYQGRVTCRNLITGLPAWRFKGDGLLTTAPVIANGRVYMGSSGGHLYALDAASGALQWTVSVGGAIPGPDEQNVSQPLTGMGVGSGVLAVPAGSTLHVYGN